MNRASALLAGLLLLGVAAPARGQEAEPFQNGKPLTVLIGFGPGGGYDQWGRLIARHMGKHLPGKPSGLPQNMPGAGSYATANYIYNVAPKDGTVIGIIARDAAVGTITGPPGARFDPLKISWVGTPTGETNICIANKSASVKTFDDLFTHELIVGDVGPGTGTRAYPKALAAILGMKFRLVAGFNSSSDVFLAMERGEVDGICESLDSVTAKRPDWISSGAVNVLFQGGAAPNPELKGVPYILDRASNAQQREAIEFLYAGKGIGRPFIAPPDLPPVRLKMLREAFIQTLADPDAMAEAQRLKLAIEPLDGSGLQALITRIAMTRKPVIDMIGELIK